MACIDATIKHEGDPPFVWVAEIQHSFKDGCHVFTSESIPGLLVVSQSLAVAIRQLPFVICQLVRRNLKFDCTVQLGSQRVPESKIDQPDFAVITKKAA